MKNLLRNFLIAFVVAVAGATAFAGQANALSADVNFSGIVGTPCSDCNTLPEPINAWGDVHMRTPDGLVYDFQAAGEFLFVKSDDGNVVVQTRQELWERNRRVAVNTAVAMSVARDTVAIYLKPSPSLYINNEKIRLPFGTLILPNGGSIKQVGNASNPYYVVHWPNCFATSVKVYPQSHIDVGIARPDDNTQTIEGLAGNLDGNPDNDIRVRNGKVLNLPSSHSDLNRFGDSWRIGADDSLFHYESGTSTTNFNPATPAPVKPFTVTDLDIQTYKSAKQRCQDKGVADPILLDNCILDIGATDSPAFVKSAESVQTVKASKPDEEITVVAVKGQHTLLGQWVFDGSESSLQDKIGKWGDIELKGAKLNADGLHLTQSGWARARGYKGPEIATKTLIAWVKIDDLTNPSPAGSPLSIDAINEDKFDAIVFGERVPYRWMAGSSFFRRTNTDKQLNNPETRQTGKMVKIAITYEPVDNNQVKISIYKDDQLAVSYNKGKLATWEEGNVEVIFGPRHTLGNQRRGFMNATILKAEIHNVALTADQLRKRGM